MRAGWNARRQMERCRRWRGASTAAASGGKAQDKDTLTVRAARGVTVISRSAAASLEYKICDIASQLLDTAAAALQYFLPSAEYTAASNRMCSYSVIILIEIPHKSTALLFPAPR